MFTPQEVSEKTFPKASGFNNGYGMAAVDEFLDALTEDYTALYKDNAALKAKLKVLAEKVEEYRATEDAMRSTLLSAQRMAAQMVSDAQAQRDKMLSDAQEEANRQVAQLEQQVAQAQHKLTMAQNSLSDFLRRSADLCAQQVSFLRSLPEAEVEEGQPVTLPAPEEGRVPVADAAEEPAAPVEEAPAEEAEAPATITANTKYRGAAPVSRPCLLSAIQPIKGVTLWPAPSSPCCTILTRPCVPRTWRITPSSRSWGIPRPSSGRRPTPSAGITTWMACWPICTP